MAADDFSSLVDLRAGTILSALAAADFAFAEKMGVARDRYGGVGRSRVPNRLRNFLCADDRALGVTVRQPRFTRGGCCPGLVRGTIAAEPRRLAARDNLFINVSSRGHLAKRRPDTIEIRPSGAARS